MEILEIIKKTREYLDYIEEHINNVQTSWEKLRDVMIFYIFLNQSAVFLDDLHILAGMSKMSESEFVQYRKAFYPTEKEKESGKYDMSEAWNNHKKHNTHHWQNWTQQMDQNWEVCCVGMIIDWMAMSLKFGGTAEKYYSENKAKIKLPSEAKKFIFEIFNLIKSVDSIMECDKCDATECQNRDKLTENQRKWNQACQMQNLLRRKNGNTTQKKCNCRG